MALLGVSTDAKTIKGEKQGYLTGILYLAPHTLGGGGTLCPDSTPGCRKDCLYSAGRGAFTNVQESRIAKTQRFRKDRAGFMTELVRDIAALVRKAARKGMRPVVRLNGTSDLPWENITLNRVTGKTLMELFPGVQFYDYTKSARRMAAYAEGRLPVNYHLTFSRSECNENEARAVLSFGGNVAVVFDTAKGKALPATWNGYAVIDGDQSDLRFADPSGKQSLYGGGHDGTGFVVGLRAKGKARRDTSGFVVAS